MKPYAVAHLVKSEDLNHHGTLFAGRMSEWFVEAGFIAAAERVGKPESVVCVKMHGLLFRLPARKGDILMIETRLVKAGRSSLTVYGRVRRTNIEDTMCDGFITFVCVDGEGRPFEHGITLPEPEDEEDRRLRAEALNLR